MEKLYKKAAGNHVANNSNYRNSAVLRSIMQVVFVLTLLMLVLAVSLRG